VDAERPAARVIVGWRLHSSHNRSYASVDTLPGVPARLVIGRAPGFDAA
jgi:hypothetical protein